MKNNIVLIISVVISLFVGYYLYPIFNDTKQDPTLIEQVIQEQGLAEQANSVAVEQKQSSKIQQAVKSNELTRKPKEGVNDEELIQENNVVEDSQEQSDYGAQETVIENSQLLADLQVWSSNHKESLKDLLDNNLPVEHAEKLMELIEKDNPFLNEPQVNQDSNRDEAWAYKMLEIFNNEISQHQNALDIEVMSLTCKQLTCEMLVREITSGKWMEVYISLIKYFYSNQYKIQTQGMKQFRYRVGEELFFYQHFIFAE